MKYGGKMVAKYLAARGDERESSISFYPAKDVLLNENDKIYVLSPDQPIIN